jgi:hypothetical protein
MNPLAKAVGTLLVLAAGTLGTTLEQGLLPDIPGLPTHSTGEGSATDGNETGNETSTTGGSGGDGNATGNATGNQTGGAAGNETGNQTAGGAGNATGNQTGTPGNETADSEEPQDTSVCDFYVDEWNDDLTPTHHEWEWAVTRDVTSLSVDFESYGGVPTSLNSHPEARLVDGSGRVLARASGGDGGIHLALERGTDYLASGTWRLDYDSSDAFADYSVAVYLHCAGDE